MNYKIFRIIIWIIACGAILLIGELFLTRKRKRNDRKSQIILVIVSSFIATIIIILPLGANMRFKTLEGAFKYYFPRSTMVKTYSGTSYAFVYLETQVNKDEESLDFVYFVKDKKGWNLGNTDELHYGREKASIQKDRSFIIVNRIEKENKTGVYISTSSLESIVKDPMISDSVSTDFELIPNSGVYSYIGIIDEVVDENYTIIFNDKKYQPLK